MTAIVQIVLFMLAVLVLVAVVAQRLNIAPSILLVVAGIGMALIPGLPPIELAPELVLLVLLPPLIYSAGVVDELARIPLQPAADHAARLRLRRVHHLRGRRRGALSARLAMGRSASCSAPSSRRRTWWRRSPSRAGSALPRRLARGAGGRRPRQRRHRADPLPLRGAGDRAPARSR